jgi:hypothetical protein
MSKMRFVAAMSSALFIGASTYAVNLVSGEVALGGVNSGTLGTLTGGTQLASMSNAFITPAWGGTLYTTVIRETTGTLSFLYQVNVTAGTKTSNYIPRMTTIDFTGYTTDVDYFSDAFTGFGFVAPVGAHPWPNTADRYSPDVIGFRFSGVGDSGIYDGDTTNVMYIRTNATWYKPGVTNFIDGNVTWVDSYAPTVPGPFAVLPFAIGFAASLLRRRK